VFLSSQVQLDISVVQQTRAGVRNCEKVVNADLAGLDLIGLSSVAGSSLSMLCNLLFLLFLLFLQQPLLSDKRSDCEASVDSSSDQESPSCVLLSMRVICIVFDFDPQELRLLSSDIRKVALVKKILPTQQLR